MFKISPPYVLIIISFCLFACSKHEETRNEMMEICFKAAPQLRTTFNNLETEIIKWQENQEKFTRLRDAAQTEGGKATAEAKLSKIESVLTDLEAKRHKVLEQIEMIAMESEGLETKLDKIALEDLSRRTGDSVRDAEELREGLAEESGFEQVDVSNDRRLIPATTQQVVPRPSQSLPDPKRLSNTTWADGIRDRPAPRAVVVENDDAEKLRNPRSRLLTNQVSRAILVRESGEKSLKSQLHDQACKKASAVYAGTYNGQKAIYSIQWMSNNAIRGSIFLYQKNRQLLLYGTNYEEGILRCEIWEAGRVAGRPTLYKKRRSGGGIAWSGFLNNGGNEELYFARKYRYGRKQYRSAYSGKVGGSSVDVKLSWREDATASGTYYSRSSGRRYRLEGDNTLDGILYLDEYTDDNLSARAVLKKSWSDGAVSWQGIMYNTDGRNVPIYFTKR